MNKLWLLLTVATMVFAAFSGCSKKDDHGDHTDAGDLDPNTMYDSAVADTGFRVTGSLTGTGTALQTGADGAAASIKANDLAPDDASGTDKADFLVDAKETDGSRLQAELRSMTTANGSGLSGDFFGGIIHNQEINGDTGLGYPELAKTKAYILLHGLARVKQNNNTLEDLHLVQVAVVNGIRDAGAPLTAADDHGIELHVLFPGSLLPGNDAFPGAADGFAYFYFENVKLEKVPEAEKSTIGSRLQEPSRPNVPPTANAVVLINGTQNSSAEFDPDTKFLNVTLDASNSTDADGTIEAYSWSVQEFNATGAIVDLNKTSGASAPFSFTSGGTKIINLRIIDEDGGIANTTLFFFVNTKKTYGFDFGSGPLTSAGGGTTCQPAFNCHDHSVTVFYGAKRLTTTAIPSSQTGCNGPHQDLVSPAGEAVASGNPLDVPAEELTEVGKYKINIWFTSQAACDYSFILSVNYAPDAAAAPEPEA